MFLHSQVVGFLGKTGSVSSVEAREQWSAVNMHQPGEAAVALTTGSRLKRPRGFSRLKIVRAP